MTIAGAVILAAAAGTLIFYGRAPRLVAWLLLLVGIGATKEVTGFLGGFSNIAIYGVGIFSVLAVVGCIAFWNEGVKKHRWHRVRTPIISVAFGVALMSAGGGAWANLQSMVQSGTSNVDRAVTNNLNGK